jgi:hypothetical protein
MKIKKGSRLCYSIVMAEFRPIYPEMVVSQRSICSFCSSLNAPPVVSMRCAN